MARPEFTPDGGSKEVLLEVKTTLPVLHYPQIIRPRLRNILEDAWNHPVTCLTAPAGSGKTTALVQAVMADQRPVAWLTLDPSDDDYARFWRYVFLALSTINPGLAEWGEEFRAALAAENNEMVPVFLDQMAHSEIDGLLILDGVEHLIQPTIRESLREVLSYLPDGMHVILSGRMDSLELSQRLDLTGLVIRRDPAELNFTREEIEAYCQLHAVNLDARSLASLVYCSEGWPAGVAGLLQPLIQGDRETLGKIDCQNLNETLAAYIQEEILRDLDPDELDFLTKTSILSKLNPEACRLLTGVESSAELLNHLCHGPLLMEAIPGRPDQYRIHRLIRLVLTRQLHQRYGETAQLIHRRAADWYSARSEWGKAFRCLKAAGHARSWRHLSGPMDPNSFASVKVGSWRSGWQSCLKPPSRQTDNCWSCKPGPLCCTVIMPCFSGHWNFWMNGWPINPRKQIPGKPCSRSG